MNNLLHIRTPAQDQAAARKGDLGLESLGLDNLCQTYWNLPDEALYEEIVFRSEGRIAKQGPIVVDNISDLGRTGMTEADAGSEAGVAAAAANGGDTQDIPVQASTADEATAEPEHDTLREERADSDPAIADADATNQSQSSIDPDNEFQPALAEEGDSTGARHE